MGLYWLMSTIQRNLCTKLSLIIIKSELLTAYDELGPQRRISIHKRSRFITSQQIYKPTLDKCWISSELKGVTAHILRTTQKWKVLVGITSKSHFYAKRALWLICWELFNYIEKGAVDSSQHEKAISAQALQSIFWKLTKKLATAVAISAAILLARSMHSLRKNALIECACYH